METNSVKSMLFFFNNKRSDFKLDQTSSSNYSFCWFKGPEELPLNGNLKVKGLELLTLCAGSQLNELWLLKKAIFIFK